MTDVTVRPATPADAADVAAVARASWHAAYDGLLGVDTVEATVDEWYDADRLADATRADGHVFQVAETGEDDSVVAFAHAVPDDGTDGLARLRRIYALPERWGTGVGTALLERVESVLRDRGFDRLRLVVFAENEVGVGFYESREFERVGEREERFDGEVFAEYVYGKAL